MPGDGAKRGSGVMEAAQKVQESLDTSSSSAEVSKKDTSQRRKRVKDLFYAMDKDGNGKLDVGEFRGNISWEWYCSNLTCIHSGMPALCA